MNIEIFGRPTLFKELAPGAVFRAARPNEEFLGLKVVMEQFSGWIVLDPPPSEAQNGVLFLERAPQGWAEKLIFELTEATLRPSLSFVDWSLKASTVYGSGDVVLSTDGNAYLCAIAGHDEVHVDLKSGQIARHNLGGNLVVVRKWSVVQMIDRKPRTVVEFTSRAGKRHATPVAAE